MKTLIKLVFVLAIAAFCNNISAQSQKPVKLAHIDMAELIGSMPERDSAMANLQKLQKELETELESLHVERNRKYEEYTKNNATWTALVKQSREEEIRTIEQKISEFQQSAYETLQQEQEKLLQPVIEKANKAIDVVSRENNITYVFNSQALVFKAVDSQDILELVQKQLGVKK
ncbi:MAG: OmpH family outer membrane protein [Bacteroidales bacterium]|jgi:outer membrane protein|nr:OmpH family outer membrane protein [Bacteroidales bacterium]